MNIIKNKDKKYLKNGLNDEGEKHKIYIQIIMKK